MKIGIDISQIVYKGTGVARFTNGLVNTILDLDRKSSWAFFFSSLRNNLDPALERRIRERGHILIKWKLPPTLLSILFNDLHNFSKYLASNFYRPTSLDWLITSDWVEPPLNIKKATIVHDLVYLRYPETVDKRILETQKKRLSLVKKESQIVFADSQATKSDLVSLLSIDSKKIFLNYPGVEAKKPTKQEISKTLNKYNLNKPFILTVGKLEPRKNLDRLLKAWKMQNASDIDLVVVGSKGWETDIVQSINRLYISDRNLSVKFLGFVNDIELSSLYSSCLFFIFPSIWEGFGYPVVEAMALSTPVATSNTSSLSEIAKDAALLFDPLNVNDISSCIDTLIHNEKLRDDLGKKAKERSRIFTWKKYFTTMINILTSN